jgi:DNA invertase Pin-like site-specific DNA recombinase
MGDARRGRFDVVIVWAFDLMARSVRHLLETLDELNRLGVEFISFRENIDTGGPLGRAIVVIVGAIAELERNLIIEIIERVRAECAERNSKASDRTAPTGHRSHRGAPRTRTRAVADRCCPCPWDLPRMVSKVVRESKEAASHEGLPPAPSQVTENRPPETVA